jgi:hypothetical protein
MPKVIKDRGDRVKSRLMTTGGSLIIPAVQFEVVLLPQRRRSL